MPTSPEEVEGRLRLLPPVQLVQLRLLVHLLLQRCLVAAVHLAPQVWAQGVVAGVDVEGLLERLLLEHLLLELRPPAWAWEAAGRQRLRHRACWAVSSWWRTNHKRTAHDPNLTPLAG